jgi:hypothetical protein
VSLKAGSYEQTLTPVSFSDECECSGAITTKAFVPQGGKAVINWEKPSLKCSSGRKATIKSEDVQPPCFSPPLEFGVGRHGVTYTYGYLSGTKVVKLQCPIEIDIIGMYCGFRNSVSAL